MVKDKNQKRISLNRVLLSKLRQDLKSNILQYLAIILIAALAVSLFTGLGANYRVFQSRIKQIYSEGNMADLWYTTTTVSDKLEQEVKSQLSRNDKFEKRLVVPVNISDPFKKDSVIDHNYSLIVNDEDHKLNIISKYYTLSQNGKRQEFIPKTTNIPMVFLPYSMSANTPVGSKISIKIPFSIFVQSLLGQGYEFEKKEDKVTGKIINKNTNEVNDLTFYINFLASQVLDEHCVNGDKNNNLINKETVFKILNKMLDSNTYFEMDFTLGGYVDQPESTYRNSIIKLAFTTRKHLLTAFNNSLIKIKKEYNDEFALLDVFLVILKVNEVKNIEDHPEELALLESARDRLKNRYTDLFFDYHLENSFIRRIDKLITDWSPFIIDKINSEGKTVKEKLVNKFTKNTSYFKDKYYNQFVIQLSDHSKTNIENKQSKIDHLFTTDEIKNTKSVLLISQNIEQLYSNQAIQSDVIQSNKLMYVFPLIFFLVSFLVIISTNSQMILKERIQIGTLKSLGITKHEITKYYCMRSMVVVLIGIVIGFLTGPFVIPFVMDAKYQLLYNLPTIKLVFPWLETIIITIVFLVLVAIISIALLHGEIKTNPSTLMRPKVINMKFKPHQYKKNSGSISRRIAIRNIRTNPFRSLMTVIGVMGCCALVLVGLGIGDTIDYGINHDMSRYYNCDLVIRYKAGASEKIANYLKNNQDVLVYENFYSQPVTIMTNNDKQSKQVTSIATSFINNSSFYKPGKNEKPSLGKTNISKRLAEKLSLSVGDTIKIITFEQQEFSLEVERIMDAFFVQGVVFNLDDPACGNLIKSAKISYVRFRSGINHSEASKLIEQQEFVVKAYTNESNQKLISDVMGSIKVATTTILVFAIMLAAIVLYNLMKLNLNQRQREIATLKVLGFNHNEITKSIMIETMLLTFIGIVLGLGLGYPFLILVMKINETDVVTYLYKIFFESFVLASSCLILAAYIISSIVANTVKRFKMIEMLKSVE